MSEFTVVSADDVEDSYEGTSTGHYHEEREELYTVARGTLTMRFGDEVRKLSAGSVARVAPRTPLSHRNEGDGPVEMWAVSRRLDGHDAVKLDDLWETSPDAAQQRPTSGP